MGPVLGGVAHRSAKEGKVEESSALFASLFKSLSFDMMTKVSVSLKPRKLGATRKGQKVLCQTAGFTCLRGKGERSRGRARRRRCKRS